MRSVMHNVGPLENSQTKRSSGTFELNDGNDIFHENDTDEENDEGLEGVNLNLVEEAEEQYPVDTDMDLSLSSPSFGASYLFTKSNSVSPTAHSRATDRVDLSDTGSDEIGAMEKGDSWEVLPAAFNSCPATGLGLMFGPASELGTGPTTDHGEGAYLEGSQYTANIVTERSMNSAAPVPQLVNKIEILEAYYYVTAAERKLKEDPKFKKWRVQTPSRLRNSVSTLPLL